MHLVAILLLGVVLGFVSGYTTADIVALRRESKIRSKHREDIQAAIKSGELIASIKQRLDKAEELMNQQVTMMENLSGPSKGASHAKHRNSIVSTIKTIEEEKINIFRSIVKDGFDPKMQMMNQDGSVQSIKMSEVIANYEMNSEAAGSSGSKAEPVKPVRKLSLVKNEE